MQIDTAFALTRPGNISDSRILGTGPAPIAKVKTNLHYYIIKFLVERMPHCKLKLLNIDFSLTFINYVIRTP